MDSKSQPQTAFSGNNPYAQQVNYPQLYPQAIYASDYYKVLPQYPASGIFPYSQMMQPSPAMMYAGPGPMVVPNVGPAGNLMQNQQGSMPPVAVSQPAAAPVDDESKQSSEKKDKSKRKTADGRIYKCNKCDKAYLSYPALYTHTKLKHLQTGESPSITNGRMRGRPRKAVVIRGCDEI